MLYGSGNASRRDCNVQRVWYGVMFSRTGLFTRHREIESLFSVCLLVCDDWR